MRLRQALPVLAALLALGLVAFVAFTRLVTVRADMADFLPPGETPAARLLIDELRSGAAASLLLIGIEGAPAEDLARISGSLAEGLRASGLFSLVGNGSEGFAEEAQAFLFGHRYLLSSATTREAFTVQNLRARLHGLLEQLAGSAAPLAKRIGFADPLVQSHGSSCARALRAASDRDAPTDLRS